MNPTGPRDNDVERPRRRSGRRRALAAAAVVLTAAAVVGGWAARSKPSGHRLIYAETLPDGRVFECFSDGAFIGSPGSKVEPGQAPPASDGSLGGPGLVVRPPDYDDEQARQAAEAYRKSGRTPDQDQADFDRLSAECDRRR